MNLKPKQLTISEWDEHYRTLQTAGINQPSYGGALSRHLQDGNSRLQRLRFDNSVAALNLWNFLLTEEDRLHLARKQGQKIIGTMKDLGTVPLLAYALDNTVAFYPDGAWWLPCLMEFSTGLLEVADSVGLDESFCPVRAMIGAFLKGTHFPIPDLLLCSVGAVCDDFSAIAQRLEGLGFPICWWEMPHRRTPDPTEEAVKLASGSIVPRTLVNHVRSEFERLCKLLEEVTGQSVDDSRLKVVINRANHTRTLLRQLRHLTFTAERCPLPALELLVAEMLIIHYCSDQKEVTRILGDLLTEVRERIKSNVGFQTSDAVKVFWVNPVADLKVMNLLEQSGGRLCGTEFLFTHALNNIAEDVPPLQALAQAALDDPMIGSADERATRICQEIESLGAEAVVISRIPGASHCAWEGSVIADEVKQLLKLPVIEIEVPPVCDSVWPTLKTRIEALCETVHRQRRRITR